MTSEAKKKPYGGEIDFNAIFAVLWKRRMLIVLGTLAISIIAAGFSFVLPKIFRSEAYFQFGGNGLPIPLYKNIASQFIRHRQFLDYARLNGSFFKEEIPLFHEQFKNQMAIKKSIFPVYAFSKEDQRVQGVNKTENNSVLGLALVLEAKSPKLAAKMVTLLGRYIRDCLIYETLLVYISNNAIDTHTSLQEKENTLIENRFKIEQQKKMLTDMRVIQRKYPEAARITNPQILSTEEGGWRFLSPVNQIVGIESTVISLRQREALLEREREELRLRVEFFDLATAALIKIGKQGEALFNELKVIFTEMFSKKDLRRDPVRQAFNLLKIDQQKFDRDFNISYRFVSNPTVPTRPIRPSTRNFILVAFFLAGFFFIGLSFILSWWSANKLAILKDMPRS